MKIGIMTMHRVRNYGSYLQAYGLKKTIENLGHDVVFIDYKVEAAIDKRNTFEGSGVYRGIKKILRKAEIGKNKIVRIIKREKEAASNLFIKAFDESCVQELGVPPKRAYQTEVDVLVIGSDEVFNCTQGEAIGFSRELFGADNHAGKVISYAASFGNTTLEKLEKYHVRGIVSELLKNFSALSVRDKNSYNMIQTLTGRLPETHLDPVLIYDFKSDIRDIVEERDYIVVYAYNDRITEEEGKAIRQFADAENKKLISIVGKQTFCDKHMYCKPLEVLSYFKHADYVITDTFHGTIFSVINHKQFATIVRSDEAANGYGNQEKLSSLLEKLKLEGRSVKDLKQLSTILKTQIDYRDTDEVIQEERIRTQIYLKKQLVENQRK